MLQKLFNKYFKKLQSSLISFFLEMAISGGSNSGTETESVQKDLQMVVERNQKNFIILCAGIGLCSLATIIIVGISIRVSIPMKDFKNTIKVDRISLPMKDFRNSIEMDKMISLGNLIYAKISLLYIWHSYF